MERLNFVERSHGQDIAGDSERDVLFLEDGTVLVITEETIVLYPNIEAWQNTQKGTILGIILRPQAHARIDAEG